jgi:hypothetical protein
MVFALTTCRKPEERWHYVLKSDKHAQSQIWKPMPIWGRCTNLKQRRICNLWTYISDRNVVVPKIAAKLWNWSAIDCSCFLNTILQNWKKVSKCGTSYIYACRERSRHIRRFHTLLWMCDMHRKNILLAKTNQHEEYIVGSSMCVPLP